MVVVVVLVAAAAAVPVAGHFGWEAKLDWMGTDGKCVSVLEEWSGNVLDDAKQTGAGQLERRGEQAEGGRWKVV